jgi:hypothetical protein
MQVPFSLGTLVIRAELHSAGFADVSVEAVEARWVTGGFCQVRAPPPFWAGSRIAPLVLEAHDWQSGYTVPGQHRPERIVLRPG